MEAVHATRGHVAHAELTCSDCGERLRGRDLELRHGPGAPDGGILVDGRLDSGHAGG